MGLLYPFVKVYYGDGTMIPRKPDGSCLVSPPSSNDNCPFFFTQAKFRQAIIRRADEEEEEDYEPVGDLVEKSFFIPQRMLLVPDDEVKGEDKEYLLKMLYEMGVPLIVIMGIAREISSYVKSSILSAASDGVVVLPLVVEIMVATYEVPEEFEERMAKKRFLMELEEDYPRLDDNYVMKRLRVAC